MIAVNKEWHDWMTDDSNSTYIAGDNTVLLSLLDERGIVWQGVTSGHEVLVGLLVPVLREAKTTQ